jgi:general secretion pathway protein H
MPTSAIGEKGFTLIELLAVLMILSLATAAVLLVVPAGRNSVKVDAELLAARVAMVRDEAIIAARPMAVVFDSSGYRFEQRRGRDWIPVAGKKMAPKPWADGMSPPTPARVEFDSTGAADRDATVILMQAGEQASVKISADGRVYVGG